MPQDDTNSIPIPAVAALLRELFAENVEQGALYHRYVRALADRLGFSPATRDWIVDAVFRRAAGDMAAFEKQRDDRGLRRAITQLFHQVIGELLVAGAHPGPSREQLVLTLAQRRLKRQISSRDARIFELGALKPWPALKAMLKLRVDPVTFVRVRRRLEKLLALERATVETNLTALSPSTLALSQDEQRAAVRETSGDTEKIEQEEWGRCVVAVALQCIARRIPEKHFKAFDLYYCQSQPVMRVARTLELNPATVYVIQHRILKQLKQECVRLGDYQR